MASTLEKLKSTAAQLPEAYRRILLEAGEAMRRSNEGDNDNDNDNDNDDSVARPKRGPGRPRLANSDKSKSGKAKSGKSAKSSKEEKRGPGRPRKTSTEDAEMSSPRRNKSAKDNKPAKNKSAKDNKPAKNKPAAKKPAPAATTTLNFSDMSRKELMDIATAWKIENSKLLKNQSALARVLTGIQKIANSENRDFAAVEKMARRAKVELVFGKGRPPTSEEGLKRRALVKMANEGAFTG